MVLRIIVYYHYVSNICLKLNISLSHLFIWKYLLRFSSEIFFPEEDAARYKKDANELGRLDSFGGFNRVLNTLKKK